MSLKVKVYTLLILTFTFTLGAIISLSISFFNFNTYLYLYISATLFGIALIFMWLSFLLQKNHLEEERQNPFSRKWYIFIVVGTVVFLIGLVFLFHYIY